MGTTLVTSSFKLPSEILTPRLRIRRSRVKDVPAIYNLLDVHARDMLSHWHDFNDNSVPVAYRKINNIIDYDVAYSIFHGAELIGFRWFEPSMRMDNYLTTGSWFGPNGRGQGFAKEALMAFIDAIKQTDYDGLETGTRVENVRTQKLFKACGFELSEPRKFWGPTMVDMQLETRVKVS